MRIEELERLEKSATPAPWKSYVSDDAHDRADNRYHFVTGPRAKPEGGGRFIFVSITGWERRDENTALIAEARNALHGLLSLWRAVTKYRDLDGEITGAAFRDSARDEVIDEA